MLPFALHDYRTLVHASIRAAPYSLVYGMEAVLPLEVETPLLRVLMEANIDEAEHIQTRFNQINLIDEKRLTTLCHTQLYQRCLKKEFDKKVLPQAF